MTDVVVGERRPRAAPSDLAARAVGFFHELDAWTEYWDVYRPETRGRYYFGVPGEPGLLHHLVPTTSAPPVFLAWKQRALGADRHGAFERCLAEPALAAAVVDYDALVIDILQRHYGSPADPHAYLSGMHLFATDALPPATERQARISPDDSRYRTSGRHTIDADMMWFVWALQLEAATLLAGPDEHAAARALLLAGVAAGCAADFAWRGHRRTRREYHADDATAELLLARGCGWAGDVRAGLDEVHELYRIREWGDFSD